MCARGGDGPLCCTHNYSRVRANALTPLCGVATPVLVVASLVPEASGGLGVYVSSPIDPVHWGL